VGVHQGEPGGFVLTLQQDPRNRHLLMWLCCWRTKFLMVREMWKHMK